MSNLINSLFILLIRSSYLFEMSLVDRQISMLVDLVDPELLDSLAPEASPEYFEKHIDRGNSHGQVIGLPVKASHHLLNSLHVGFSFLFFLRLVLLLAFLRRLWLNGVERVNPGNVGKGGEPRPKKSLPVHGLIFQKDPIVKFFLFLVSDVG